MKFGFKDLDVWRKAISFADNVVSITENLNASHRHFRLVENIEASAASIAANIAEGKGRQSKREFIQHLFIARGSLYETVTFLEIFHNKKWVTDKDYDRLLSEAEEIVKMVGGLILSIQKRL